MPFTHTVNLAARSLSSTLSSLSPPWFPSPLPSSSSASSFFPSPASTHMCDVWYWHRAMSGTGIAYDAFSLRDCHAVCRTDSSYLAHARAMRSPLRTHRMTLSAYALSMRNPVLTLCVLLLGRVKRADVQRAQGQLRYQPTCLLCDVRY
eukprot:2189752-Rhodomonas_salina.1